MKRSQRKWFALMLLLVGCSEDCPPCQEPKTFPINFGGQCVKTTSDPKCSGYVGVSEATSSLRPQALCQNSANGDALIGVWETRPAAYGLWIGEVREISRASSLLSTKTSAIHLCPDLKPGRASEIRTAIDGPVQMRIEGWGYSSELERYWIAGRVHRNDQRESAGD